MFNRNVSNNGVNEAEVDNEGLSPGTCPVDRTRRPRRHHATVRKKWSTQENVCVMKCYHESKPDDMEFRKRLLSVWEGKGLFNVKKL